MRRTAAMLLAGVAQSVAVLVVVAALAPRLGSAVAILVGAIGLLITRPLHRRVESWLRMRLGDPEARRAALLRRLGGGADIRPLATVLARTLRLRYASVDVEFDDAPVRVSEFGVPGPVTALPVEHRGARVGSLRLGPPATGGPLRARQLVRAGELAALAAPALAAERLRLVMDAERGRAAELRVAERAPGPRAARPRRTLARGAEDDAPGSRAERPEAGRPRG